MNPRLVEPGFAIVCLHADVPARPDKDENREDDAQVTRQHGKVRIPAPPGAAQGGHLASTDRARCLSTIGLATRLALPRLDE